MSESNDQWVMPEWMEPYRDLFADTGGNSIERLMNISEEERRSNVVLSLLNCCVGSQVSLLYRLRNAGHLVGVGPAKKEEVS